MHVRLLYYVCLLREKAVSRRPAGLVPRRLPPRPPSGGDEEFFYYKAGGLSPQLPWGTIMEVYNITDISIRDDILNGYILLLAAISAIYGGTGCGIY